MNTKRISVIVVLVAMMALPVSNVKAADTKIGVGYEGMLLGNFLNGASVRGWWGNIGAEGNLWYGQVGLDDLGLGDMSLMLIGGKVVWAPIVHTNSKLYVGAGVGWGQLSNDVGVDILMYGPLFGAEYNFQEIPEMGFNWELGYMFNAFSIDDYDLDVGLNGLFMSVGVHYYITNQ